MRLRALVCCTALVASAACQAEDPAGEDVPAEAAGPTGTGAAGSDPSASNGPEGGAATAPGTPPTSTAAKPDADQANRFLVQASFGAAPGDAAAVEALGYARWIERQAALPPTLYLPRLEAMSDPKRDVVTDLFWEAAIEGEDQLRQRVAYALSNIVVVSLDADRFWNDPETFAHYYDVLSREALGNYTDLVRQVSLSPAMGLWLSHLGNRKADDERGFAPDENYARELMQLFTIGLEELNPDGTGTGRETYATEDVLGLASVFTGLSWADTDFEHPRVRSYNRAVAMESFRSFHEEEAKAFLGTTVNVGGDALDSVEVALDHLLAHPNLAPFVCRQLIQHLVTSNPEAAYVARVVRAFETGAFSADGVAFGEGRRGDMAATVAAILLDPQARDAGASRAVGFGRLRDPALRFSQLARAFRDAGGPSGGAEPTSSGNMRYAGDPNTLGMEPLSPPSVFGWYRPGYVSPGGWAARNGKVAPEMQLVTGSNVAGYVDFMARAIRGDVWGTTFFDLDLTSLEAVVGDPSALVDALDARLTYGAMQDDTKARIAEAVGLVTIDDRDTEKDRRNRLRLALLMAVTAPEYAVQR